MFASDRDLLALEPTLFRDVGWAGQRLVKGSASISFITLSFESQDVGLDAAAIQPGHVVIAGGVPLEVVERLSDTDLTVSRLRADSTDDAVPPAPVEGADAHIITFRPQIGIIHRQTLRLAGLVPGAAPAPGEVAESAVTNPGDLAHLEALGALHLIYSGAASGLGSPDEMGAHAEHYRTAYARERERTVLRLDLDGDGHPDASRWLGAIHLSRD